MTLMRRVQWVNQMHTTQLIVLLYYFQTSDLLYVPVLLSESKLWFSRIIYYLVITFVITKSKWAKEFYLIFWKSKKATSSTSLIICRHGNRSSRNDWTWAPVGQWECNVGQWEFQWGETSAFINLIVCSPTLSPKYRLLQFLGIRKGQHRAHMMQISSPEYYVFVYTLCIPTKCAAQVFKSEAKTFRSPPDDWSQYRS